MSRAKTIICNGYLSIAAIVVSFFAFGGSAEEFVSPIPNGGFETGTYEHWQVYGEAFGKAPSTSSDITFPERSNMEGDYFANSLIEGEDLPTGKLVSSDFELRGDFLSFLITGGNQPGEACVNLVIDGRVVYSETGQNNEMFRRVFWRIGHLAGKTAHLEVIDECQDAWGYIRFDDLRLGSPPIGWEGERLDAMNLDKEQISMLIGYGLRGFPGHNGFVFGPYSYDSKYGFDSYDCFGRLFAADGFNAFSCILNLEGTNRLSLGTDAPGWVKHPDGNMEFLLRYALQSEIKVSAELLIAGFANATIAREHPDWRIVDENGTTFDYMGPQLCPNSPFFKENLLPLYHDIFSRYGQYWPSLIVWEYNNFPCACRFCKEKFANQSEFNDLASWRHNDCLEKLQAIHDAIRSTGWQGKIIGGGYGGYDWEELRWDQTVAGRNHLLYNIPEIDAFNAGIIQIVKPELLVHTKHEIHAYRRKDMHYVYRSLMYGRSIYGRHIFPNVELFWEGRSMTPEELLRWMLEVYCAGLDDYSVVDEWKLYTASRYPDQEGYRLDYRTIFKLFNQLPGFGEPVVDFQFVVSDTLEREIYKESRSLWEWYVRETSKLFKSIDSKTGGGAIVNVRKTDLPAAELYGITSPDMPRYTVVPDGYDIPEELKQPGIKILRISEDQPIDELQPELLALVRSRPRDFITGKSEEISAMVNVEDNKYMLTLINHTERTGNAEIDLKGGDFEIVVDSQRLIGRKVYCKRKDDIMIFKLAPHSAITVRIQP